MLAHCDLTVTPQGEIFRLALCEYGVSSHFHRVVKAELTCIETSPPYIVFVNFNWRLSMQSWNHALHNKRNLYSWSNTTYCPFKKYVESDIFFFQFAVQA